MLKYISFNMTAEFEEWQEHPRNIVQLQAIPLQFTGLVNKTNDEEVGDFNIAPFGLFIVYSE